MIKVENETVFGDFRDFLGIQQVIIHIDKTAVDAEAYMVLVVFISVSGVHQKPVGQPDQTSKAGGVDCKQKELVRYRNDGVAVFFVLQLLQLIR